MIGPWSNNWFLFFPHSRKIELLPTGVVRVDNWINLNMDPKVAAAIAAFRPAIESLVIRASTNPETINELNQQEDKAIQVLRQLSKMNTARHGMEQVLTSKGQK